MKKLSFGLIICFLLNSFGFAKSADFNGKIRFIGEITASSCEIVIAPHNATQITFDDCEIDNPKNLDPIPKLHTVNQQPDPMNKNLIRIEVVYK